MATATGNMRTVLAVAAVPAVAARPEREELESVTLTLTPKEAGLIASLFGLILGPSDDGTPRHVWSGIYRALDKVKGVRWPTYGGHGVWIRKQIDGAAVSIRLEWRDH